MCAFTLLYIFRQNRQLLSEALWFIYVYVYNECCV